MEQFKSLCRDYLRAKIPTGMYEFARNILLKKGISSVSNDEGFDYHHDVPGEIIGCIDTNEELVYFSVDDTFSYIGIYKTIDSVPAYIPKLKSRYLGFKKNRPIEGVFFYNFKKELIIAFCDGIIKNYDF